MLSYLDNTAVFQLKVAHERRKVSYKCVPYADKGVRKTNKCQLQDVILRGTGAMVIAELTGQTQTHHHFVLFFHEADRFLYLRYTVVRKVKQCDD